MHVWRSFLASNTVLKNVHFFWVNRDTCAFEWFATVLAELEDIQHTMAPHERYLTIMPFFTGSGITAEQKQRNAKGRDGLTGLRAPSKFSRPDWDKIFTDFAQKYAPIASDSARCHFAARKAKPSLRAASIG